MSASASLPCSAGESASRETLLRNLVVQDIGHGRYSRKVDVLVAAQLYLQPKNDSETVADWVQRSDIDWAEFDVGFWSVGFTRKSSAMEQES